MYRLWVEELKGYIHVRTTPRFFLILPITFLYPKRFNLQEVVIKNTKRVVNKDSWMLHGPWV